MTFEKEVSFEHVVAALEGYLKAMSILDDDDTIVDVKDDGEHFSVSYKKDE